MLSWFDKRETRRKTIQSTLHKADEPPQIPAILDGDEEKTTAVEDRMLGKLARLQPFSPVAIRLLRLFDRDDADINQIVKLVQSDAALAAEILAYANSPLIAVRGVVVDLHHAIAVLGANHTKNVATTLAMRSMLKKAPKPGVVRRLWQHSIATAVIAAELAPTYGVNADLANTAGVLHDVGRVGLLAQNTDYAQFIMSVYEDVPAILQAERDLCALDHCDVGMYLSHAWKLPDVFRDVASQHHRAEGQTDIVGLIHLSCSLADDLTFSAIAHRAGLPLEDRLARSVPEALRDGVRNCWAGAEDRIRQRVNALDF